MPRFLAHSSLQCRFSFLRFASLRPSHSFSIKWRSELWLDLCNTSNTFSTVLLQISWYVWDHNCSITWPNFIQALDIGQTAPCLTREYFGLQKSSLSTQRLQAASRSCRCQLRPNHPSVTTGPETYVVLVPCIMAKLLSTSVKKDNVQEVLWFVQMQLCKTETFCHSDLFNESFV